MLWKINILSSQIKDKFSPVEITKANILKDHVVERFTFGSHMLLKLSSLELTLNQFHTALNCCNPESFLRMGTLYPEMSVHERAVDFYIELLRKDQLDENVPIETIEKSLTYFQQIFPLHLGQDPNLVNHGQVLSDSLKTYNAACDCLHQLSSMIKCMMTSQDNSEMASMLKIADANASEIRQVLKTMKRRLPSSMGKDLSPTDPLIKFDVQVMDKMLETCKTMILLVKAFYSLSRMSLQQQGSEAGIPPAKLMDLMFNIVDQVYEMSNDGVTIINKQLGESLKDITEMNKSLQDGDWDTTDLIERGQPPVSVRSEIFKNDIKEAENLKYKIENKDLDIKELKKLLKMKTEEMSEMQVRKDKAEKRLSDAAKESELMREKLQRKLDDANETLKRKEKEFEDTMDHLQKDLDSLESEKGELNKKLKETTMNVLLQGLAGKGSPSRSGLDHHRSGSTQDASLGPSLPAPIKDSPMLMMQLQDLQLALASLRQDSYRRQGQELQQRLAKMKPIVVPTKTNLEVQSPQSEKKDLSKEDLNSVDDLAKKVSNLRNRINVAITSKSVPDFSSRQVPTKIESSPENLAFTPTTSKPMEPQMLAYQLQKDTEHLRLEVARLLASKRPGGQVDADFAQFPTPLMAKAMLEKDCKIVGRVKLTSKTVKTVPLIVGPSELKQIHQTVLY